MAQIIIYNFAIESILNAYTTALKITICLITSYSFAACNNYTIQQPLTANPQIPIMVSSSGVETETFTKDQYDIIKKELNIYETDLNTFIERKSGDKNLKNEFNIFLDKATKFIERTDATLQSYEPATSINLVKNNTTGGSRSSMKSKTTYNRGKCVKSIRCNKCVGKSLCSKHLSKKIESKSTNTDDEDTNFYEDFTSSKPSDNKTYSYLESIKEDLQQFDKKLKNVAESVGSTFFLTNTNTEDLKSIKDALDIIDKRWEVVQKNDDHTEFSKAHFYSMYENLGARIALTIASTNVLDKDIIAELQKMQEDVDKKTADLLKIENIENT